MEKGLILPESVEQKIFFIRGQKVMLDTELAKLYGIQTKRLNEQVRRNKRRFPDDFMFQLTKEERDRLVANCDQFQRLKHSSSYPYAFTEQGVAMLSTVLHSERAIQVNIAIMRAFVKLHRILSTHKELAHKLQELERKTEKHDTEIKAIFDAIRQLMAPAAPIKPKRRIGFHP